MRELVEAIAVEAGKAIMDYYPIADQDVNTKEDGSPITAADLTAHRIILEGLKAQSPLPVVSEESYDPKVFPPSGDFWLVDPLDGTKDFIHATGHFTVNIALIADGKAKAGVIYAPVLGDVYSAFDGVCRKDGQILSQAPINCPIVGGSSSFHKGDSLNAFFDRNQVKQIQSVGSSLKFCLLAEGALDIYPRLSPTSQWDTAAGQAIAEATGCKVIDLSSGEPLRYGNLPILNPYFVAAKKDFDWV